MILAASLLVTGVAGQLVRNREYRRNVNNCIHRGGMCLTRNRVNNCHRTKIFYKSENTCVQTPDRAVHAGVVDRRALLTQFRRSFFCYVPDGVRCWVPK